MQVTIVDMQGAEATHTCKMPATIAKIKELCVSFYKHKSKPGSLRVCCAIVASCIPEIKVQATYEDSYDPMEYGGAVYEEWSEKYTPQEITRVATELLVNLLYPRLEPSIQAIQRARNFTRTEGVTNG